MFVQEYAPMQQAAISRLQERRMRYPGITNLLSSVQGMKSMPPPNAQQLAQIHALLGAMNLAPGTRRRFPVATPMPYPRNMPPPVYEPLPATRTYGDPVPMRNTRTYNDPLHMLLSRLG